MLDVDFHLQCGDFQLHIQQVFSQPVTGIMGASGSGKSTLLAAIAGLIKPQQGYIHIDQRTLFNADKNLSVPAHLRRIGLVFQDNQLLPHLNVHHNLLYGYNNIAKSDRIFSPNDVINLLEIGHLLQRKPRQLSGGEQQRVALGRAILYAPHLLLLDEPLSALDERLKQQILPFLLDIKNRFSIPMIYVSHAISEVQFMADECLVMDKGKLVELTNPSTNSG